MFKSTLLNEGDFQELSKKIADEQVSVDRYARDVDAESKILVSSRVCPFAQCAADRNDMSDSLAAMSLGTVLQWLDC